MPNESRGSNFVLKLDDRTLPSGFRMTTDQVQIQRATSGKALQVNFGASIHRVVSIDLLDAAFEPGKTEIRDLVEAASQLTPRGTAQSAGGAASVLRRRHGGCGLVKRRVDAIKHS